MRSAAGCRCSRSSQCQPFITSCSSSVTSTPITIFHCKFQPFKFLSFVQSSSFYSGVQLSPAAKCNPFSRLPALPDRAASGALRAESDALLLQSIGCTASEAASLLEQVPLLASWVDWMLAYGFSNAEVMHIISSAPKVLASSNLVHAGNVLMRMQSLGLEPAMVITIIVHRPPLLGSTDEQVVSTLQQLARFSDKANTC